jgi:hypothetical protein
MLEGGWKGLAFHIEAFTRAAEDFRVPGELRTVGEQERNPLPAGCTPEPRKIVPNSYLRAEGLRRPELCVGRGFHRLFVVGVSLPLRIASGAAVFID